jgi:rare lipoprotein A
VRRPDINTAVAVGMFVASSCMRDRPPNVAKPPPAEPPIVAEPAPVPGESSPQTGFATYYARRFAGRRTANGERYDPSALTAAHRTLPFGTFIEVRRADGDGRRVVVRVNDRGPYGGGDRIVDLSRRAAEELGIVHDGKVKVELRLVGDPSQVTGANGSGR